MKKLKLIGVFTFLWLCITFLLTSWDPNPEEIPEAFEQHPTIATSYWVQKLKQGQHQGNLVLGGTSLDQGHSIGIDSNDNLFITGATSSQQFNLDNITYEIDNSFIQMFLAKLIPNEVGIEEFLVQDIHTEIYPNPNSGIFSIVSEEKLEQIEIYNLQGEKVFEKHFSTPVKQEELESSLNTGVYVLQIKTEAGNYTDQKMMVGK